MNYTFLLFFISTTALAQNSGPTHFGFRSETEYSHFVDQQIRDHYTRCAPCGERVFCGDLNRETLKYCKELNQKNPGLAEIFKGKDKVRYADLASIYRNAKKSSIPLEKPIFLQEKRDFLRKNSQTSYEKYLDHLSGNDQKISVAPALSSRPPLARTSPVVDQVTSKPEPIKVQAATKIPSAPKEPEYTAPTKYVAAPKETSASAVEDPTIPKLSTVPPSSPSKPVADTSPKSVKDNSCDAKALKTYLAKDNFCACETKKPLRLDSDLLNGCNQILDTKYSQIKECVEELDCQNTILSNFLISQHMALNNIDEIHDKIKNAKDCREELAKVVDSALQGKSEISLYEYYAQKYVTTLSKEILSVKYPALDNEEICDFFLSSKQEICKKMLVAGGLDALLEKDKSPLSYFNKYVLKDLEKEVYHRVFQVVPVNNTICQTTLDQWYVEQRPKTNASVLSKLVPIQKFSLCKSNLHANADNYKEKRILVRDYSANVNAYHQQSKTCFAPKVDTSAKPAAAKANQ